MAFDRQKALQALRARIAESGLSAEEYITLAKATASRQQHGGLTPPDLQFGLQKKEDLPYQSRVQGGSDIIAGLLQGIPGVKIPEGVRPTDADMTKEEWLELNNKRLQKNIGELTGEMVVAALTGQGVRKLAGKYLPYLFKGTKTGKAIVGAGAGAAEERVFAEDPLKYGGSGVEKAFQIGLPAAGALGGLLSKLPKTVRGGGTVLDRDGLALRDFFHMEKNVAKEALKRMLKREPITNPNRLLPEKIPFRSLKEAGVTTLATPERKLLQPGIAGRQLGRGAIPLAGDRSNPLYNAAERNIPQAPRYSSPDVPWQFPRAEKLKSSEEILDRNLAKSSSKRIRVLPSKEGGIYPVRSEAQAQRLDELSGMFKMVRMADGSVVFDTPLNRTVIK